MRSALAAMTVMVSCLSARAQDVTHVDASTPREVQVRIAKLAGPKGVTDQADIYVIGEHGYEVAERGSNGFSCMIEREKPDTMEPECYDAEGTRTTVKVRIYVEEQRAKGVSDKRIENAVKAGYKSGKFRAPSKPGIVYMLSDSISLLVQDKIVHVPPHLMFYAPYATEKDIGSPPPSVNMPRLIRAGQPDAYIIVFPKPVEHAGH